MPTLLSFNWLDHIEAIVVGAVLLVGFGIYAYVHGWPQRTIQSLNDVTEADEKALARIRREKEALAAECEGFKSDVARLMREAKIHLDMEEQDAETIRLLKADTQAQATTIVDLRKELTHVYERLNAAERRDGA